MQCPALMYLWLVETVHSSFLNFRFYHNREDIEWVKELPYTITIPSLQSIFVHAGLLAGKKLEEQDTRDMSSIRNVLLQDDGSFLGTSSGKDGIHWTVPWESDYHVYYGHDAKKGLQLLDKATGLDSGCCYGS